MSSADRFHALVRGETRGPAAWLARAGLWWAQLPYGAAVWVRNRLFDRAWRKAVKVPVPVVCVGNLTLGGTGKTPCVEYVAGYYRDMGYTTAILSRGYGAEGGRNDEAMVLEENLPDVPHLQGRDRVELAMTALQELESEVLVLDDGFQHRRLARDLDIVLVDATRPFWLDYLFPRGTLREPFGSLRRAGIVVVTRCDGESGQETVTRLRFRFPDKLIVRAGHVPVHLLSSDGRTEDVDVVRGRTTAAFCGIGNPDAFATTVATLTGEQAKSFRVFPDHHNYTRADVDSLKEWAAGLSEDAIVLTTQKDLVKLRIGELSDRPLRAVRIAFRVLDHEDELRAKLKEVVSSRAEE